MAKKTNDTKTVSSPAIETHKEIFLAKIAGEDVSLPDPITHEEIWLKKIAEKPAGSQVVANPTLAGTEAALTGLEVNDTKYVVTQPTKLYVHNINITSNTTNPNILLCIQIITPRLTDYNFTALYNFLYTNFNISTKNYSVTGFARVDNDWCYPIYGVYAADSKIYGSLANPTGTPCSIAASEVNTFSDVVTAL